MKDEQMFENVWQKSTRPVFRASSMRYLMLNISFLSLSGHST